MSFETPKQPTQTSMLGAIEKLFVQRPRLMLSTVCGLVAFFLLPHFDLLLRFLLAWNVCSWTYLSSLLLLMWRAPLHHIRQVARLQDEDEDAGKVLAFVCLAAIASLVAIILQLATVNQISGWSKIAPLLLTVLTLAGAWLLVPTAFAIHYAHLFYQNTAAKPVLLFPDEIAEPMYTDFLYFSFTIAVAAQTADVGVGSSTLRRLVLIQSILAFVFNLAILGLSINIGASLLV